MRKETILVTGAAGLIGWNFIKWLLRNTDHQIVGTDAMCDWGNHNMNPESDRYKFYRLQLGTDSSQIRLDQIVHEHDVKIIYHFASYAAEGLSPFMRKFNYMQNTIATSEVINSAVKYGCKLIFTSSMSVYGHGVCTDPGKTFDENDMPSPIDPYGIAKYGCEQDIKAAGMHMGLDWVIIRPHNVFGIGQNVNDRYRNVIGIWMHQAYNREPMTIYGDGEQERAFTYVDNIMEPLYKAIELHHEIINLGGKDGITINSACNIVAAVTGWDEIIHLGPRYEVKRAIPNPSKSIELLNYKDVTSFKTGIEIMWEWVKNGKVKEWYVWDTFELDKGIYSYWKKEKDL